MNNIFNILKSREENKFSCKNESWYKDNLLINSKVIRTLQNVRDLEGHEHVKGCVNTIAFNESGNLLVSGSDDATIKIWDVYRGECLKTLKGHISNVFTAAFLQSDNKVVSGGNEADVRYYDIESDLCTVYHHHLGKVLNSSVNKLLSECWMTCSSDGSVRMFDARQKYSHSESLKLDMCVSMYSEEVIPQAYGGGRIGSIRTDVESVKDSLILNYRRLGDRSFTLYNVCCHPLDVYKFIVSSDCGDIRMFDLRMIRDYNPKDYINIYSDSLNQGQITGCAFSYDGKEIISSKLDDDLYLYETDVNYKAMNKLNYVDDIYRSDTLFSYEDESEPHEYATSLVSYIVSRDFLDVPPKHETTDNEVSSDSSSLLSLSSSEDEEVEETSSTLTFKRQYNGHMSSRTIKGCWFWGPRSEFIVSGSDNKKVFIYNKESSVIEAKLCGHDQIVNCVAGHPTLPILASSGIDNMIKIWEPVGDCLPDKEYFDSLNRQPSGDDSYGGCVQQ